MIIPSVTTLIAQYVAGMGLWVLVTAVAVAVADAIDEAR